MACRMDQTLDSQNDKPLRLICEEEKTSLQTRIYFHAVYSEVQYGETVRVVGNHPAIGAWNPDKGLPLITNDEIFPCWISTDPIVVELHARLEYKYIVVGDDG